MTHPLTPRENLLRVIHHNNPQWVPSGLEARARVYAPLNERPTHTGLDAFGSHWSLHGEAFGGTHPTEGNPVITDILRWREQLHIPDIDADDWSEPRLAALQIDRSQFLVEGFVQMGIFERSHILMGMEEALMAYLTEPDEMAALLTALADHKIATIQKLHEVANLDMIRYGDDWGTQQNLFLPPETWRAIIKPQTKRIFDCCKSLGLLINQHSCGKIESIFADLVEIGADIWNPCQPCNDLAALKRNFSGRITFCGGIDSQFVLSKPNVTAEEVRQEVRRRIDEMAHNGGYIADPSHGVPYDPAVLAAMEDEITRYGREIYQ
ncbi:MAG: hypothetical protein FWD53_04990 [Phycisphaerales bacterium]|nr:hypothetical protein [Phycisphaerales bacterium]